MTKPKHESSNMRRGIIISVVLVVATLTAYWPVRHAGFTNFDDPDYITNNPDVFRGLTWHGVVWAFTTIHGSNWHPLTWLSHITDCQVFGDKAGGHHLVNVGFHAANALLLFLLLWRMTRFMWRSAFVAAMFALHPLHVESVAWISERKDVLSMFFGLLTLMVYARYVEPSKVQHPKSEVWYGLALVCFALGLLSKPMLVTLPFVLLLLDYWPLGRFELRIQTSTLKTLLPLLREKLPFFGLAVVSSAVTYWAQKTGGAVVTIHKMPLADRFANASVSYLEYLSKTFWPSRLAAYYPFSAEIPETEAMLGVLVMTGLTVLVLAFARRAPYLAVGWLWFAGTLVPVIGLVQVGSQAMADRYTYVPLVGLFVALVWGATEATAGWRWRRLALVLGGGSLLAVCFVFTQRQVRYWENSITLFSHAIQVTRDNALAQHNLGHALSHAGRQPEAIEHFDEALRIKPGYPQAHFNRGNAYGVQGKVEQAIADYREAIRNKQDYEQAYCNLGKALALEDKLDEARTNFMSALRYKADYAEAHTKLGNVLALQGKSREALEQLCMAVRIQPDYDEGQYFLGAALARQKNFAEAAARFRAAIKVRPEYAAALNDLAWLLATHPDPQIHNVPEAVELARRACKVTGHGNPSYLDTLAVAQSEAGQLREAIQLTEKASELANETGDTLLAGQLQAHLASYRAGHSYSQGPKMAGASSPK